MRVRVRDRVRVGATDLLEQPALLPPRAVQVRHELVRVLAARVQLRPRHAPDALLGLGWG